MYTTHFDKTGRTAYFLQCYFLPLIFTKMAAVKFTSHEKLRDALKSSNRYFSLNKIQLYKLLLIINIVINIV
jgi:hypothetical protein